MSFDSSRFTFNPWNDFSGVVMQQGRVQVDADWNEWLAELNRRIQAGSLDTYGRAAVPKTTPEGFHITIAAGLVNIGPGRIYVDGLLAENHGLPLPLSGGWTPPNPNPPGPPPAGLVWDTALAELVGQNPVPFNKQPYLPGASFPTAGGPFLVYVDVWQREVTYIENPDLVEKAVGVDTTGRLQTVWQVKTLDVSKDGAVTCATPDTSIPEYTALLKPPGAQLTTGVVQSSPSGPCCLAPNTGYTGLENQLYRVEIHLPPASGKPATFKWSRDDASVATGVSGIANGGVTLRVQSLGRDNVLRFSANDWIEITDDVRELQGLPGELRQIKATDPSNTITLFTAVTVANYPVDGSGNTKPERHTRIRRWDQKGKIFKSDAVTVWADLDAVGATGDIPVPPAGTTLLLEDGVTVAFGLASGGLDFQTAQCWTFAARSTDGTVEFLDSAPPRGIHHHYARLAVVTLPGTADDCRPKWPPETSGDCCCCTVNVKPTDLTGGVTLQTVLDQHKNQNSTVICLAAGTYNLPKPLHLTKDHSNITIEACLPGVVTLAADAAGAERFTDGLVILDHAANITFRNIVFKIPFAKFSSTNFGGLSVASLDAGVSTAIRQLRPAFGIRMLNVAGIAVEDCRFTWADEVGGNSIAFGAGIFASGGVDGFRLERSTFTGTTDFLAGYLQMPWAAFNPLGQNKPTLVGLVKEQNLAATPKSVSLGAIFRAMNTLRAMDQPAAAAKDAAPVKEARSRKAASSKEAEAVSQDVLAAGNVNAAAIDINKLSASQSSNGGKAIASQLDGAVFRDNTFTGLSIAVFAFGTFETVELTGNSVSDCHAGIWLMSPLDPFGVSVIADPLITFGVGMAAAYPLPDGSSPKTQTIAAAPAPVRVYTGAAPFKDSQGNVWTPDTKAANVTVTGGTLSQPKQLPPMSGVLPGITDQPLYQNERAGADFTYTFSNLPVGYYTVTLKFAELTDKDLGQRLINVAINGQPVVRELDMVQASGPLTGGDEIFGNIPSDGKSITIQFTGDSASKDPNAKIGAIEVTPQWAFQSDPSGFDTPGNNQGNLDMAFFAVEASLLAQQGFSPLTPVGMQLRIEKNEIQSVGTLGILVLGDDVVQKAATSSLIFSSNRVQVDAAQFLKSARANDPKEGSLSARMVAGAFVSATARSALLGAVTIFLVTRCVVDGNLIVNDTGERAASLVLFDVAFPSPTATVPPPEICVSGNVLHGRMRVIPLRAVYLPSTVPVPMNTWEFLNTVIT